METNLQINPDTPHDFTNYCSIQIKCAKNFNKSLLLLHRIDKITRAVCYFSRWRSSV